MTEDAEDPLTRPEFDRLMGVKGYMCIREDGEDLSQMYWFKSCIHGCRHRSFGMDPEIYDPEVLQLLLHDVEDMDCGHDVHFLSAVPDD